MWGAEQKTMPGSLDHLSPCMVSLVTLAGFPEVMAPNAVNKERGEMRGPLWGMAAGLG